MIPTWHSIDTWMVVQAIIIAVSSTFIGLHLVLKRESLLSDAISHSVLPGIAIAYIIAGSRLGLSLFVGAIIMGFLTSLLVDFIIKHAGIEASTSMGVVFSGFFALGLVLISQVSRTVDLDPNCVLFGALELTPLEVTNIFGPDIPISVLSNGTMLLVNAIFLLLSFRILNTSTFDRSFAISIAMPVTLFRFIQISLLTLTTVLAFESVGSILIIAFLIVPPIIGWLSSHTMRSMLLVSLGTAIVSPILGHVVAIYLPPFFGVQDISTTGSIVSVLGILLFLVLCFSPRTGLLQRTVGKIKNQLLVASHDILKNLYVTKTGWMGNKEILKQYPHQSVVAGKSSRASILIALFMLRHKKLISYTTTRGYQITETGTNTAKQLVSRHRAWESYLFSEGMDPSELHLSAEQLEHSQSVALEKSIQEQKNRIPGHSHG